MKRVVIRIDRVSLTGLSVGNQRELAALLHDQLAQLLARSDFSDITRSNADCVRTTGVRLEQGTNDGRLAKSLARGIVEALRP